MPYAAFYAFVDEDAILFSRFSRLLLRQFLVEYEAIDQILQVDFAEKAAYPSHEKQIRSSLASVCITYAYLDWLAGAYGDIPLDAVIDVTKNMLGEQLSQVTYRKFSE